MSTELIFTDAMTWNTSEKTGVSVRDGVIEYYGFEIGHEPADKLFTVYRSPATIAQAAIAMIGIPLIAGHIDPDLEPHPSTIGGTVDSAEVIDHFNEDNDSKLAILNKISINDSFMALLDSGERELSLGYKGKLVPHHEYDFEQRNIIPRHLGVVPSGRCGSSCSFIDRKGVKPMSKKKTSTLKTVFLDAEGQPNLEQIVEISQALPEALKELPIDELQKVLPALKQIVEASAVKPVVDDLEEEDDTLPAAKKEPVAVVDEEANAAKIEEEDKKFEDAVSKVLARHTAVIEKARSFVDEGYTFVGKDTKSIMRDALAAQYGDESFTDAELPVAFKLLKQRETDLTNFGDAAAKGQGSLTDRVEQSLKGGN